MPKPNVKEQIVTTSLNLLHSKGFNATSVQDITEAAGVPKGSFYNHFASKEALGIEVLQRYASVAGEHLAMLDDTALEPKARLARYFGLLIEANAVNDYNCGCLLGNFSSELSNQIPAIRTALRDSYDEWSARLAVLIAEAQRGGSVSTAQPALELANFIIDAWQGAVLHAKAAKSRAPLERFLVMTLDRILM